MIRLYRGGEMVRKIVLRFYIAVVLAFTLSGCSAIRSVGDAIANSLSSFKISFPTFRFP